MKLLSLTTCVLLFGSLCQAQDFSGYRTGNNTGVNGVFYNPANIADSRYRWDFNLFSVSTAIGNNKASFKLKDIGRTLDGDSLKNKIFSDNNGPSSGFASVVLQGPSLMFNLNKKSALAFTTRARAMANIVDVDGKLARQVIDDVRDKAGFPYTVASNNNMVISANGWTEFGASYAREIINKGHHYLKGGISLKYLAGAANASINLAQLNTTINYDALANESYLSNATGRIGLGFGGVNTADFEAKDLLKFKSTGFGADIGLVYEYRPDTVFMQTQLQRDRNKYKLRLGLALLDAGSISYNRDVARSGTYDVKISGSQRFYLSRLRDASVDDFKDTLNKYPQFFKEDKSANAASYAVALPATLQIDADYHVAKGFYVNMAGQVALTNSGNKVTVSQYYNSVALTPRLEGRKVGLYLPLSYNALTKVTAGASLRLGTFFIGSGSVLSAALGSSKQADVFIGFHIGSPQKKTKRLKNVADTDSSLQQK